MPYTSFFSLFCYSSFPIYTYTVNEEISARGHLYKNPLIQGRLYFSGISFIFLKLLFCLYICASCKKSTLRACGGYLTGDTNSVIYSTFRSFEIFYKVIALSIE